MRCCKFSLSSNTIGTGPLASGDISLLEAHERYFPHVARPLFLGGTFVALVKAIVAALDSDWAAFSVIAMLGVVYGVSWVRVGQKSALSIFQVEVLCILTTLFIVVHDVITEGHYDMWLWLLLVAAVMLVSRVRDSVRISLAATAILYITATTVQEAYGVIPNYADAENRSDRWFVAQLIIRLSVYAGNYYMLYGAGAKIVHLLCVSHAVATELARFDIDTAEYLLLDDKLDQADLQPLRSLVVNLRRYKPHLPDIILASPLLTVHRPASANQEHNRGSIPSGSAQPLAEGMSPLAPQSTTREVALLHIKTCRGFAERALFNAIVDRAKVWNGWVHSFDSESALLIFGAAAQEGMEGLWGSPHLTLLIKKVRGKGQSGGAGSMAAAELPPRQHSDMSGVSTSSSLRPAQSNSDVIVPTVQPEQAPQRSSAAARPTAEAAYMLKSIGDRFRQDPAPLHPIGPDSRAAPAGFPCAQYHAPYGNGVVYVAAPLLPPQAFHPRGGGSTGFNTAPGFAGGGEFYVDVFFEGVTNRDVPNGEKLRLTRSHAVLSCAAQCALALKDFSLQIGTHLKQALVYAETCITVYGDQQSMHHPLNPAAVESMQSVHSGAGGAARQSAASGTPDSSGPIQVSGDGFELVKDIMAISMANPRTESIASSPLSPADGGSLVESWMLVCSGHTAALITQYGMCAAEEIHAGPDYDGPISSLHDPSLCHRRLRQELLLLESLPGNREVPLTHLRPPGSWCTLGSGKAGEVWLGRCSKTSTMYAIKELRFAQDAEVGGGQADLQIAALNKRCLFLKELLVLNDFRHERIVNFFGYSVSPNGGLYLLTEYCSNGTLQGKVYQASLTPAERVAILMTMGEHISQALSYIHERQKAHMDVAARNIFITSDAQYKLGDLGMVRDLGAKGVTICYPWAPPEAAMCPPAARTASTAYDAWSFGMTCYEVLAGAPPYGNAADIEEVKTCIRDAALPVPDAVRKNRQCKQVWDSVVQFCLLRDPKARPLMAEVTNTFKYGLRQESATSTEFQSSSADMQSISLYGGSTGVPSLDPATDANPYSTGQMYAMDEELPMI